ncbi:MAG: hypothetical protein A3D92_21520, partial [Bacteroidetes bacterium RIFCSPHIGHO2_02_FULL_44_7]
MRITLAFFLSFLGTFSFGQTGSVHFTIKNAPSNNCVMGYYYGDKQYVIGDPIDPNDPDSEKANVVFNLNAKGEATFSHPTMKTGMYMLVFQPDNQFVEFIYEGKDLDISFDYSNQFKTFKSNSKANVLFNERSKLVDQLNQRSKEIEHKVAADSTFDAQQAYALISEEYTAFNEEMYADNSSNLAVLMLRGNDNPSVPETITDPNEKFLYYRAHYFDHIDFKAPWIVNTSYFDKKISTYFSDLTYPVPDSIILAWDQILTAAKGNAEVFKYLVIKALNMYAKSNYMGQDAVYVHLLEKYYFSGAADWVDEENLTLLRKSYTYLVDNLIGKEARPIALLSTANVPFTLHDIEADYTIVQFTSYESCGACGKVIKEWKELKEQIPANVRLLEIANGTELAALRETASAEGYFWESAILAKPQEWEAVRTHYDLRYFPKTFVLDKNKVIIGKNIGPAQVLDLIKAYE